jgi:hypothetical protein
MLLKNRDQLISSWKSCCLVGYRKTFNAKKKSVHLQPILSLFLIIHHCRTKGRTWAAFVSYYSIFRCIYFVEKEINC